MQGTSLLATNIKIHVGILVYNIPPSPLFCDVVLVALSRLAIVLLRNISSCFTIIMLDCLCSLSLPHGAVV